MISGSCWLGHAMIITERIDAAARRGKLNATVLRETGHLAGSDAAG